eukprot:9320425-Pyramimonas_sp.AAC.1
MVAEVLAFSGQQAAAVYVSTARALSTALDPTLRRGWRCAESMSLQGDGAGEVEARVSKPLVKLRIDV